MDLEKTMKTKDYKTVALFGYQFLYQNGDPDFHVNMVKLGLSRSGDYRTGKKRSVIVANDFEYFLMDCNSVEQMESEGSAIADGPDDFYRLIRQLKEKH